MLTLSRHKSSFSSYNNDSTSTNTSTKRFPIIHTLLRVEVIALVRQGALLAGLSLMVSTVLWQRLCLRPAVLTATPGTAVVHLLLQLLLLGAGTAVVHLLVLLLVLVTSVTAVSTVVWECLGLRPAVLTETAGTAVVHLLLLLLVLCVIWAGAAVLNLLVQLGVILTAAAHAAGWAAVPHLRLVMVVLLVVVLLLLLVAAIGLAEGRAQDLRLLLVEAQLASRAPGLLQLLQGPLELLGDAARRLLLAHHPVQHHVAPRALVQTVL